VASLARYKFNLLDCFLLLFALAYSTMTQVPPLLLNVLGLCFEYAASMDACRFLSRSFQTRNFSFLTVGEKDLRFFFGIARRSQDGMMTAWMKAKHHFCARRTFDAQALGADRESLANSILDLTDSLKEKHGRHGCSQFEFLRHLAR
jgi:hypothetical protein